MLTNDERFRVASTVAGSIEPGKLADFIVLDADPREIDPERLLDVEAERTYLSGRLVYQSD